MVGAVGPELGAWKQLAALVVEPEPSQLVVADADAAVEPELGHWHLPGH